MPDTPKKTKRVRKPKKEKVKQGHKLVWFTLIIILIPFLIVGYVLLTSAQGNNHPVEGNRFGVNDLQPCIQDSQMNAIQGDLLTIGGVESATINLESATLRVNLNMVDNADNAILEEACRQAYDIVNNYLPIDTYFTNSENGKNYDLEISAYNYIVDDQHPADGWHFTKLLKTAAASDFVVDHITQPKNPELAEQVRKKEAQTPQAPAQDSAAEQPAEDPNAQQEALPDENLGYYDEYGNFIYYQ